MAVTKQLTVYVQNRVGSLAKVCSALAAKRVNIRAVEVLDQLDWGLIRLVVDDAEKAKDALSAKGFSFGESNVVAVELDNRPGALTAVAKALAAEGIGIHYAYASAAGARALAVLSTTDNRRADRLARMS